MDVDVDVDVEVGIGIGIRSGGIGTEVAQYMHSEEEAGEE